MSAAALSGRLGALGKESIGNYKEHTKLQVNRHPCLLMISRSCSAPVLSIIAVAKKILNGCGGGICCSPKKTGLVKVCCAQCTII